jgi:hypothetical protein
MVPIPPFISSTIDKIFETYSAKQKAFGKRHHLGASEIGRECERQIWYGFHWVIPISFPPRILRLFDTGKHEEDRLINDLRAAGVTVVPFDLSTGKQFRFTLFGGHFGGSLDGIGVGLPEAPKTWHLLEFKTHNEKSFKELEKKGVEKAKPDHYTQMQAYMGMSHELKTMDPLKRAMYIAVNKNTDDLYAERIEYNPIAYKKIRSKAERVIFAPTPPPRISETPDFFQCRWCNFREVCHPSAAEEFIQPEVNCRTCTNSTPQDNGSWKCEKFDKILTYEEEERGCSHHLYLPHLLPWKAVDATNNCVIYESPDGNEIKNYEGGHISQGGVRPGRSSLVVLPS